MYPPHKVTQVNTVFDFLGNYHKDLKTHVHNHVILRNTDKQQINSKITSEKETRYLLQKSQKWMLSQNVEIVKRNQKFIVRKETDKELDILLERCT